MRPAAAGARSAATRRRPMSWPCASVAAPAARRIGRRARAHPPAGPLPRPRRHADRRARPPRARSGSAARSSGSIDRPAQRRAQPRGDGHRRHRLDHRRVRRAAAHPGHRARAGDRPRGRRRRRRATATVIFNPAYTLVAVDRLGAQRPPGARRRLAAAPPGGRGPRSSESSVTSTRTSSPTRSMVSPRGTIRRSARSTATTVASRGHAELDDRLAVGRRAVGQA